MWINPSLDNISKVLKLLDNPQDSFSSIIVAGTNGKGSVCSFLELLYLNSGLDYKIGKYISPHLLKTNERFSINGIDISDSDLEQLNLELSSKVDIKKYPLTEFEWQTLIAFEYFRRQQIDIGILEVGMGGRWDAVNVVSDSKRLATVITNIGMDHMQYLGDTLQKIRAEKEGICRNGVPHFEGLISDSMPNSKEGENFVLALKVFESVNQLKVSYSVIETVLEQFPYRYRGRFMHLPGLILDGAHNEPGMIKLNKFLQSINANKIFVLAFLDKDYKSSIFALFNGLLSSHDQIICTQVDSARATSADLIYDWIKSNYKVESLSKIENAKEAIEFAKSIQKPHEYLVVTGSLSLLAKILVE